MDQPLIGQERGSNVRDAFKAQPAVPKDELLDPGGRVGQRLGENPASLVPCIRAAKVQRAKGVYIKGMGQCGDTVHIQHLLRIAARNIQGGKTVHI